MIAGVDQASASISASPDDSQPPSPTGCEYFLLLNADPDSASEEFSYDKHVLPLDPRSLTQPTLETEILYGLERRQFMAIKETLRERNSRTAEDGQWVVAGLQIMDQNVGLGVVIGFFRYGSPVDSLEVCIRRKRSEAEVRAEEAIGPQNNINAGAGYGSGSGIGDANIDIMGNASEEILVSLVPDIVINGTEQTQEIRENSLLSAPRSDSSSVAPSTMVLLPQNAISGPPPAQKLPPSQNAIPGLEPSPAPTLPSSQNSVPSPSSAPSKTIPNNASTEKEAVNSGNASSASHSIARISQANEYANESKSLETIPPNVKKILEDWSKHDEKTSVHMDINSKEYRQVKALVDTYIRQERWREAEPILRHLLDVQTETLGPLDEETLKTMHDLADTYEDLQRLDEAERLYRRTLEGRIKTLGEYRKETLLTMNNLAYTCRKLNRLDEAESLCRRALEIGTEIYGENDESNLLKMYNLAQTYRDLGRYSEAEELYMRCIERETNVYGEYNENTLTTMYDLAYMYRNIGRLEEAENFYERCLIGRKEILGEDNEFTLATMQCLAATYDSLGRFSEAESMYKFALDAYQRLYGDENETTRELRDELAYFYQRRNRHTETAIVELI